MHQGTCSRKEQETERKFKKITKDKTDDDPKLLFQDTQGKSATNQQLLQKYTVATMQQIHINFLKLPNARWPNDLLPTI